MISKTISYYENNAKTFHDRTINVDMLENYQAFLKYLPSNGHILDAGCCVGRDAKYFLKCDYNVTAFDASKEMVKMTTKETGFKALQLTFKCINFFHDFDGVWANASLLHIPYIETQEIYQKIHRALKPGGIFYASYKKYGCE